MQKIVKSSFMLRQLVTQRALATYLLVSLSFALNLCVVESVFAGDVFEKAEAAQPSSHDCGHHADQKSQDKNQDEDQTCCSNLLAVPTFIKSAFSPDLASKSALSSNTFDQIVHDFYSLGGNYFISFSSGKSPLSVFLLSHFTHAPPVSL